MCNYLKLNKIKGSVSQTSHISVREVLHRTDTGHLHHGRKFYGTALLEERVRTAGAFPGLPKGKFREDSLGGGPAASHCSSAEAPGH